MKRYNESQQHIQAQFEEIRRDNTTSSATRETHTNRHNDEGTDHGGSGTNRRCKLDFPRYHRSTDPLPWMNRRDYYFRHQRAADEEKMSMIAPHLEDNAQYFF